MTKNRDYVLKLVIIGDEAVGKSSLLARMADQRFLPKYEPTLGIEFESLLVDISEDRNTIKLQCCDTAGAKSFRSITRSHFKGAAGALIIYDATSRSSFENTRSWLLDLRERAGPDIICVLVANKMDLCTDDMQGWVDMSPTGMEIGRAQWEVSPEEAERFAQAEGLLFIEASAKTGENVNRIFEEATRDMIHKVKQGTFDDNNSTRSRSDPNTLALEKPTGGMLDKLRQSVFDVMSAGRIERSIPSGSQLRSPTVTGIARNPVVSSLLSPSDIITLLGERGCENLTSLLDPHVCSIYPVSTGGFGDVYSGRLRNGTLVAIKAMRACELDGLTAGKYQKRAAKELYAWSKCRHPNVARLLGLAMFQGRLAMISEWASNGALPAFLRKYPNANRCALSAAICEGLAYLHENRIVYGDLKGANVLVTENGTPMLTDFGNASLAESTVNFTATTSISFSLRWTAPEILKESSPVSYAGDVYALGMTILETITGEVPFSEVKDRTIYTTVVYKKKTPPRPEAQIPTRSICGDLLWTLLLSCWARKPQLRPSAADVRDFMKPLTPEKLECIEVESSSEDES